MLLVQALIELLRRWDRGDLISIPETLITRSIPIILYQVVMCTLQTQNSDGSWSLNPNAQGVCEIAAYSIIGLTTVETIPWLHLLRPKICESLNSGRAYLLCHHKDWTKGSHHWIEKVTYASCTLSLTYCLAAMGNTAKSLDWMSKIIKAVEMPSKRVHKYEIFYSQIPMFSGTESWQLKGWLMESWLFQNQLLSIRHDIFPASGRSEKYLEYIPFTWVASNWMLAQPIDNVKLLR